MAKDLAEEGGEIHRPETTPYVPISFIANNNFYFLWRKVEGISLKFEIFEDSMTVRMTVQPPTQEELSQEIPNCPKLGLRETTTEFNITFPKVIKWDDASRYSNINPKSKFDGMILPLPSNQEKKREF